VNRCLGAATIVDHLVQFNNLLMVSRSRSLTTSLSLTLVDGDSAVAEVCLGESWYIEDSMASVDGEEAAARFGLEDVAIS
jgi:hypothetical protein